MAMPWKIRRTVDLEKWEQKAEHLDILAFTGAKNAHQLILTVFENDQPAYFDSATNIMVYFLRAGEKVTIKGSVTANVITVRFPAAAYAIQTRVSVLICAENTDEKVPLYAAVFDPGNGSENVIIDPDDVIPDVSEVLAQAAAAQEAAAAAKSAAEKANAAASHAPYVGEDGYWYAWDPGAGKYVGTGVQATGPEGEAGTDGVDGLTPHIGENGNWWIGGTDTGTQAQGPAGEDGTGSGTVTGVKIGENTYAPDAAGMVDMSGMTAPNADKLNGKNASEYALKSELPTKAEDVGALPENSKAADSAKLDGKDSIYYLRPRNLLDNSDFRNPVNQRGATSYTGSAYGIDRWLVSSQHLTLAILENEHITLTNAANASITYLIQKIQNDLSGKVLTFAIEDANGNVYCGSATMPAAGAPSEKCFETAGGTIGQLVNSAGYSAVRLAVPASSAVGVKWAALYEGVYTADNLPPYSAKETSVDYLNCRTYFKRFKLGTYAGFITNGATRVYFPINDWAMYKTPVASMSGVEIYLRTITGYAAGSDSANKVYPTAIGVSGSAENTNVWFEFASAIGTDNIPAVVQVVAGYFDLSADL